MGSTIKTPHLTPRRAGSRHAPLTPALLADATQIPSFHRRARLTSSLRLSRCSGTCFPVEIVLTSLVPSPLPLLSVSSFTAVQPSSFVEPSPLPSFSLCVCLYIGGFAVSLGDGELLFCRYWPATWAASLLDALSGMDVWGHLAGATDDGGSRMVSLESDPRRPMLCSWSDRAAATCESWHRSGGQSCADCCSQEDRPRGPRFAFAVCDDGQPAFAAPALPSTTTATAQEQPLNASGHSTTLDSYLNKHVSQSRQVHAPQTIHDLSLGQSAAPSPPRATALSGKLGTGWIGCLQLCNK